MCIVMSMDDTGVGEARSNLADPESVERRERSHQSFQCAQGRGGGGLTKVFVSCGTCVGYRSLS